MVCLILTLVGWLILSRQGAAHCFDNLKLQCMPILECFGEPHTQTWSAGFGTCPSVVAEGLGAHKALVKELERESKAL